MNPWLSIGITMLVCCLPFHIFAENTPEDRIGLGELDRLIKIHKPQKQAKGFNPTVGPTKTVQLIPNGVTTIFSIPGFYAYGCGECHQALSLIHI